MASVEVAAQASGVESMATANATAASKVQETVSEEALDIPKEETLIPFLKRSSKQKHH